MNEKDRLAIVGAIGHEDFQILGIHSKITGQKICIIGDGAIIHVLKIRRTAEGVTESYAHKRFTFESGSWGRLDD